MWLGLLRQSKKAVKRLAPHITLETIEERLKRRGMNTERVSMATDMPLSDAVKRTVAGAAAEADGRGQTDITDEYLILALLRQDNP